MGLAFGLSGGCPTILRRRAELAALILQEVTLRSILWTCQQEDGHQTWL